ncbi:phenylalanine--tRNA ligase, mitochondrial-like isoform X2 [Convolutriloba macropyga]|uniref:phenylalanine--tRNA ligase, mitochondrial-like isoform X2 n=1 Tax=Convolutriloba macropyga TaxID=536237 RepID=UPI003F51C5A4
MHTSLPLFSRLLYQPLLCRYCSTAQAKTTQRTKSLSILGKNYETDEWTNVTPKDWLLRAHTSAHQAELIGAGLPAFLVFGDVFRRDEIDSTHFPVFHQCEGVRLFTKYQLFPNSDAAGVPISSLKGQEGRAAQPQLFASHERTAEYQESLTIEATKMMEYDLKSCVEDLIGYLFRGRLKTRWVEVYFPFTHPSWEMEIQREEGGKWVEVLGCGIMEQKLVNNAGCPDRAGWAFGIGLERIAMLLYNITDIRLFWSKDERFLKQFEIGDAGIDQEFSFEPFSNYMPMYNDISFWLCDDTEFHDNDFYDIVRNVGGDIVESVHCFDTYKCPKTSRTSKAFRLTFRHFEKQLTQSDVSELKAEIEAHAQTELNVTLR